MNRTQFEMKAKLREYWILLIGTFAALASTGTALFTERPAFLSPKVSDTAWTVATAVTVPVLIMLLANQLSALLKATSQGEYVVREISSLVPTSATTLPFESNARAWEYLVSQVPHCVAIYNTRLSQAGVRAADPFVIRESGRLDDRISKRMRDGLSYHLVVSETFEDAARTLVQGREATVRRGLRPGALSIAVLPEPQIPMLQFVILDTGSAREVLIGWSIYSAAEGFSYFGMSV